MPKRKLRKKTSHRKKYLAVVLAISLFVVGGVLWLNYETPFYSHSAPVPVTYHAGDAISGTSYVFSGLYGTGAGGSNDVYAWFDSSNPGAFSIQHIVTDHTSFQIGGKEYVIVSNTVDSVVMQDITPLPLLNQLFHF